MEINSSTGMLGLLGYPLKHTLSPLIHNSFLRHYGLNMVYLPFEVRPEEIKQAVGGLKALSVRGFNVTIPYKERVISFLDEVSREVSFIGAVNTVVNNKGKYVGYNTDGRGFTRALTARGIKVKNKNILILGAGGAAKGIAFQLVKEGVQKICISNRTPARAEKLAENLADYSSSMYIDCIDFNEKELLKTVEDIDVIINTTSVGMHPHTKEAIVENPYFYHKNRVYCDIVYNPLKTRFLEYAEDAGAKTVNGLDMLLYQACYAFELWTGIYPDANLVEHKCKIALKP